MNDVRFAFRQLGKSPGFTAASPVPALAALAACLLSARRAIRIEPMFALRRD